MNTEIIEINTDQINPPKVGDDLYTNRAAIAEMSQTQDAVEVSIIIFAYNRLEKTRHCVESVLQYTAGINYELILIDNGSTDGTLEYLQSVAYERKKILHITKNLGGFFPYLEMSLNQLSRFICVLANDLIVTSHWMDNLLTCIKSDIKIGMVNPVCCNTSNLQCVQFPYKNNAEMQRKARAFNRSDPKKWEDRQRLLTLGPLFRKEALLTCGWPVGDAGFFHDFGDDDITFQVRRAGYRTVLAGDTWICHDHDLSHGEGKDPVEFQKSLDIGKANFQEKYCGVDAWEDVNNYYIPYLSHFPAPHNTGKNRILGVDVRCGTPILDVKNWLRKFERFDTELSAFTQDPKYWIDLKTICRGPVVCDREEFLVDSFFAESFDYIVVDRPLNRYHEPQKMINDLFSLCKKGGVVICKFSNTFSFQTYLHQLGQWDVYNPEFAYHIPIEAVQASLEKTGSIKQVIAIPFALDKEQQKMLDALLPQELSGSVRKEAISRLTINEYMLIIEKKS